MSTLTIIVIASGCAVVGFYIAKYLFKLDEKIEDRRRAATKLAGVLRQYGLEKTPTFLESYAVGDYSQMGQDVIDLAKLFLSGEKAVVAELEKVFTSVLDAKLKTDEGRAYVQAKLNEVLKIMG